MTASRSDTPKTKSVGSGGRTGERQSHFGDQAQRAFRANHEVAQIVAGGIFHQRIVEMQNLATSRDDFKTGHPLTDQTKTQNFNAARVGGDIAADVA